MSQAVDAFLASTVVTAQINYMRPLAEGQAPLVQPPEIIGAEPRVLGHTGIIQEFIYQIRDRSDLSDPRLKQIFGDLVLARGGIIHVLDRKHRISMIADFAGVAPLIIPKPEEQANAGMAEITQTFKTMVPFPSLRKFLQFWQDQIQGPLHSVQIACGDFAKAGSIRSGSVFNYN